MIKILLLLFISTLSLLASAQTYLLTGRITDANNKPIAFASVYIKNSTYGTATNENGNYEFKLTAGSYAIVYRFPGYKETTEKITIDGNAQHDVQMVDEAYQYRKFKRATGDEPDSAINIMRQVINKRLYYLRQVNAYSCVVYIKGVIVIKMPGFYRLNIERIYFGV